MLTWAAREGLAEVAKLLIEKGADPNHANKDGESWHHHVCVSVVRAHTG